MTSRGTGSCENFLRSVIVETVKVLRYTRGYKNCVHKRREVATISLIHDITNITSERQLLACVIPSRSALLKLLSLIEYEVKRKY